MQRALSTVAGLVLACVLFSPASAGVSPYVRVDFSGNQMKMTDLNAHIDNASKAFATAGYPADFKDVGAAYGPGVAAGLWLTPSFRVGATYSYMKGALVNSVHAPGDLFYYDEFQLRMSELGGEAALRFNRFGGFAVGATYAQGRAKFYEGYSFEDYVMSSFYYEDGYADRVVRTYGGYVGFEQTNPQGVVGYVHLGYRYRDAGRMPGYVLVSDGVTTTQVTSRTGWLDYSGIYVKLGAGFDFFSSH